MTDALVMRNRSLSLIFVALLNSVVLAAQDATPPQPSPQTTQTQAQPAPCVTTPNTPNPSGNNPAIKVPNKWQQMISKKLQKIEGQTGIPVSDVATDLAEAAKAKPTPCPPQAGSPKTTQPVAISHLPAGVVTQWLCNPIVVSTDPSHTVTFVTPDALTTAEPAQTGAFEADGAKADPRAAVSCASLRRDPKNNKVFLAQ
jgi:hypothetical protein